MIHRRVPTSTSRVDRGVRAGRMTTRRDLALLRLVAQRLAGPAAAGPLDAIRWLSAAQAQDLRGALDSIALRTTSRSLADVEAALNVGEVVRSWPMRGTYHLVAAEDLPWMLSLTGPRMLASAATRRAGLGLDAYTRERARDVAVDALRGGGQLRRDELLGLWAAAGLDAAGSRGSHLLSYLAQTGTLCFGPLRDGHQLLVLIDEWIRNPRPLERQEALGHWAERYFRSHGPATVHDFARWTGLTVGGARVGLSLADARLERLDVDGVEHVMDPLTPDLLRAHRPAAEGIVLLPGFDELLLGYADRSATLPAEFAARVVPGGNGIFRPTVIDQGQVVGTWRHVGRRTCGRQIVATAFTSFRPATAAALATRGATVVTE